METSHRSRRAGRTLARGLAVLTAAVIGVTSILLLDPIDGALPGADIDLSWPYTIADATARHLSFGRDVVFTMGPLSSLYTRVFLPDQRLTVFGLKAILVLAFCLGTVAMSRRSLRWVALALPLLLANVILTDSVFLVMPWVIVPLATASWSDRRWHLACLLALSAVFGPLLLVKGSLAVPLVVSIGAAALVLARRRRLEASALPCAALASIVVAWLAAGQKLGDLPYYLRRESYVAEGYTNAMSLFGPPREIWAFLTGAALLLGAQLLPRRAPALPLLAAAAILFVAFKAGFVRHDGHSAIAGGTLALLGLLIFLYRGTLASGLGLLAGIAGWLGIMAGSVPVDPASTWSRMVSTLSDNVSAIRATAADPEAFRRSFEAAKASIAQIAALPPTTGIVDLYPDSQAILIASNRDYYPRPVIQSYSAYTPELAFLNADHLEGPHAPRTILFGISPIDERYPAMEDGPSWPALLGQYRFRAYAQTYAVLDRVTGAPAAAVDPTGLSGRPRFGETVTVPQDAPFVWVKMHFHPTLAGRLASALFKMPLLHMDVTTADGRTKTFRVVPGMASAGFLLSPTVGTAHDFVALRSTATDVLATQRVHAIEMHEDDGLGLWGENFAIEFSPLRIPTDPAVDDAILGRTVDGPPVDGLPEAGQCTIDTVGGTPATAAPVTVTGRTVTVTGWGFVSPAAEGRDGGHLRLALTPDGGSTVYVEADRQPRPDVDAYFHVAKPTRAGFTAQVNLSAVEGPAALRVVQDGATGPAVCGPVVTIDR